ncbi:hypothetical protein VKT23_006539 [Stygiomarasmius scandens]|uniref:Uncharacterized protein n=1 Tax=Marasmiellus scandens TaxID=2682957 RepID=A0ABR1JQ50_9AGAR
MTITRTNLLQVTICTGQRRSKSKHTFTISTRQDHQVALNVDLTVDNKPCIEILQCIRDSEDYSTLPDPVGTAQIGETSSTNDDMSVAPASERESMQRFVARTAARDYFDEDKGDELQLPKLPTNEQVIATLDKERLLQHVALKDMMMEILLDRVHELQAEHGFQFRWPESTQN